MDHVVLITGKLHAGAIQTFESNPKLKIVYRPDCTRDELKQLVAGCNVLVSRSETTVDRELIDLAPNLKVIARAAVGVGNIDLDYATERGILVINTPGKNTNSAAELTIGLIVGMLRNLPQAHQKVKEGGWDRHRFTGAELRDKVIGIVGLGNVGHRVAKFAHGFDMKVLAYDPYIAPDVFRRHAVIACESLREMAAQCDILSVHVPLNKETKAMITPEVIAAMKRGSYIVNAARGGLVAEDLLISALNSGQLAGVAIDTFVDEPEPLRELIHHERVWCSPHIGASTHEAQIAIGEAIVDQVFKAVDGGVVDYPVNLPQIGVINAPILKAYSVLAEKLGSLVGQILSFNPQVVEFRYRGDIAKLDNSLLRLSWMKGYANQVVDSYVSFVNVTSHFDNLGIKIVEIDDPAFASYKSALKVIVSGPQGKELTVGGIVFDDRYLRISLINDFYFELEPVGTMLIVENHDRPGVVGDLGVCLARHGVNISSFTLSRHKAGGVAMAIVVIDGEVATEHMAEIQRIKNVVSVRQVTL